jgi:hypothetical protein
MEMTEEEIVQRYKKAEGIQEQRAKIKILAELNGCNVKTIKNILSIHGIEPPSPHPREKKTVETEEEVLKKGTDPEEEEKKCSDNEQIPLAVFTACMVRIDALKETIKECDSKINSIQKQKDRALGEVMDLEKYLGKGN